MKEPVLGISLPYCFLSKQLESTDNNLTGFTKSINYDVNIFIKTW